MEQDVDIFQILQAQIAALEPVTIFGVQFDGWQAFAGGAVLALGAVWGVVQIIATLRGAFGPMPATERSLQIEAAALGQRVERAAADSTKRDDETSTKVDEVLALLKAKADTPLDPASAEALSNALENLLSATDGARKRAADKIVAGDRDGALSELRQAAAEGEVGASNLAEIQKEIGALAFPDRTQDALDAYKRATELAPGDAQAWNQLGHLNQRIGDLDTAASAYQNVAELADGDEDWTAVALGNLGIVAKTRGDLDAAEDFYKRGLEIYERIGRLEGKAAALGNLGNIATIRGDLDAAEDFYKRALEINERIGRLEGQAHQLGNLGIVARTRGDLDAAEDFHKRALEIHERIGRLEGQATALGNLGGVAQTRGDLDAAEDFHKRALEIDERLGRLQGQAIQLGNLGIVAIARGDLDAAEAYWRRSLALYRQIGIPHMVTQVSDWLRDVGADPEDGDES